MGVHTSRMNVVRPIENSVVELIDKFNRIGQEKCLVNIILKEAILGALNVYSEQIKRCAHTGRIPQRRRQEVSQLIDEAIEKLERLPTHENETQKTTLVRKEAWTIKTHLYEIERGMRFGEIANNEYKDVLNTVVFYYQQFDTLAQSQSARYNYNRRNNKNAISVLILELFVRLPLEDVSSQVLKNPVEILKETLKNMATSEEILKILDVRKQNFSDVENMTDLLGSIKLMAKSLHDESSIQIEKLKQMDFEEVEAGYAVGNEEVQDNDGGKDSDTPNNNERNRITRYEKQISEYKYRLGHMEEALREDENFVQRFMLSVEKHLIDQKLKEIRRLLNELDAIPDLNEEIFGIKKYIHDRAIELNKILEKIEKEQRIGKYKGHLGRIETGLRDCDNIIQQFSLPLEQHLVNQKIEEIQQYFKELHDVPDIDEEICGIKCFLYDTALELKKNFTQIIKENNNIIANIEKLKEVGRRVFEIVESNTSLQDKIKFLKKQADIINGTEFPNNEEVMIIKLNTLNRIEGLIIAETINYLNQIKKTLNHHRVHAQQFGYPKRSSEYEAKRNEVLGLMQHLQNIPTDGDQCVAESVQLIRDKIDEVLQILDKKASYNEDVIGRLESLDNIKTEVIYTNDLPVSYQTKIRSFNAIRKKISSIYNVSRRILAKKSEIFHKIHSYENSFYFEMLRDLKKTLDKYENDVLEFPHSIYSDQYRQKSNEIFEFLQSVETIVLNGPLFTETKELMCDTIRAVLTLLEENGNYNEKTKQYFDSLKILDRNINKAPNTSCVTPENKLETLEQYKEITNSISSFTNVEVSHEILKVSQNMAIAESKVKLELSKKNLVQYNEYIKQLAIPLESSVYKETINEIIHLKNSVEDMPSGNTALDSNKQTILSDINQLLNKLDGPVAQILFKKKSSENILNLQRHFDDFYPKASNIPRESMEFVEIIRDKAKHFEEKVKHYLGKSDSVDYYVIHENLVRLLEELDQLTCQGNEELLVATIGVMDYVKGLMEELDANVAAN